MISFRNDYSEGAHPKILAALEQNNLTTTCGYSMDPFCDEARAAIRARFACPAADVHFLVGGTIANTTVIAAALRPWEGVIAPATSTSMRPARSRPPATRSAPLRHQAAS